MERAKIRGELRDNKRNIYKRIYDFFEKSFKVDKEKISLTKNEQFLIRNIYDTFFKNSNIPIEEIQEMTYMFYCMCIYYLHIYRNKYLHLKDKVSQILSYEYLNPPIDTYNIPTDIYGNVDVFGPDNYESYFADLRLKDAIQNVQSAAQARLQEEEEHFKQQHQLFQPQQQFRPQQQFQPQPQFQLIPVGAVGGKSKKKKLKNKRRRQTKHNKKRRNTRKIKTKLRKTKKKTLI